MNQGTLVHEHEANTQHPGRVCSCGQENYSGPNSGFARNVHHNVLVEWCWSFRQRLYIIDTQKPKHEIAVRRWCLARLDLPDTWFTDLTRQWSDLDRQWSDLDRQWSDLDRQWADLDRQRADLDRQHRTELEAEAERLVPDAPWDGTRLVFPDPVMP